MTDKQMEGYKTDYFMRFDHEPVNIEYIWDWIEDLVEEVEKECEKKSFENFKKRLMLDLEKKLTN